MVASRLGDLRAIIRVFRTQPRSHLLLCPPNHSSRRRSARTGRPATPRTEMAANGRGPAGGRHTNGPDGLKGADPESTDFANYFCTYAYIYHQVRAVMLRKVARGPPSTPTSRALAASLCSSTTSTHALCPDTALSRLSRILRLPAVAERDARGSQAHGRVLPGALTLTAPHLLIRRTST